VWFIFVEVSLLRSGVSSRGLKRRVRELEKVSARIDVKMAKLERLLAKINSV
jgi:hypothetical protein